MSELNRLRELAALFRPQMQVQESDDSLSDLDGIKQIVDEAIEDLEHKLGKGGALESMVKKAHSVEDLAQLKTQVKRLDFLTVQFKREVKEVLSDIDKIFTAHELKKTMESLPKNNGSVPWKKARAIRFSSLKEDVELTEMAAHTSFRGGCFKRAEAKLIIKQFRGGEESFDLPNGDKYMAKKAVNGSTLEAGMIVFASHDKYNTGAELYEVKGFCEGRDGPVKFKSVKEAFKAHGVSSLKALEKVGDEDNSKVVRLVVKDIADGQEGDFFYLFEGRWSYGSGAEPLSFTLVEKA